MHDLHGVHTACQSLGQHVHYESFLGFMAPYSVSLGRTPSSSISIRFKAAARPVGRLVEDRAGAKRSGRSAKVSKVATMSMDVHELIHPSKDLCHVIACWRPATLNHLHCALTSCTHTFPLREERPAGASCLTNIELPCMSYRPHEYQFVPSLPNSGGREPRGEAYPIFWLVP